MATTQTACRVCAGDLSLRVAGTNGHAPVAEAFAPSLHETGRHGDLLACVECGTVQQPLLPAGDELHELYRDMSDDAYLGEEGGRRATAAHLLDLIAAQVAGGRLLDVGCGHGLLLDEARSRGYETVGLELSRSAARHAREALGPRRPRAAGRGLRRPRRLRRRRARRRARAPRRPGRRGRSLRGAAAPRRRAVRRHARPLVGDRAPRRPALVGLRARPRVPAAARHAARAARRPRPGHLHRRAARALVLGPALGVGPGRAPGARAQAASSGWPTRCPTAPR